MSPTLSIRKLSASLLLLLFAVCALPAWEAAAQGKKKAPPRGVPVLWRAHRGVERLDLLAGPGRGENRRSDQPRKHETF